MPKHIAREEYEDTQEIAFKTFIHPDIEHQGHRSDSTHYLLTAVFSIDKGGQFVYKYPGPGVIYFTEGETKYEDPKNPRTHVTVTAGSIVHVEEDLVLRWHCSSSAGSKGICVFYVPVSVKSSAEALVSE